MKKLMIILISFMFISGFFLGIVQKTAAVSYIYTSIDFPGATVTTSYGINNSGIIVGLYRDPISHGYSYDGPSFSNGTLMMQAQSLDNIKILKAMPIYLMEPLILHLIFLDHLGLREPE